MKFEYRNAVLLRGTWFKGFDLNLVLKRTYTNTSEPQNNSKEQKPKFFPALPGYSGYRAGYSEPHCPECPGAVSGLKIQCCPESPGIYPESPGTLLPNGYFWAEGVQIPLHTPSATLSCHFDELNSNISQERAPSLPLLHS